MIAGIGIGERDPIATNSLGNVIGKTGNRVVAARIDLEDAQQDYESKRELFESRFSQSE